MSKFLRYLHWNNFVFVREDLKGKHKDYCLCYSCKFFHPGRDDNCLIANANYKLDIKYGLVTPVWECPDFEEKE